MILVGMGRVGQGLKGLANGRGVVCESITRTEGWEALDGPAGAPILVCVNAGDLVAIIERVPTHRHPDLVFVQNGMIGDVLGAAGCGNNTLGLLYFAVPQRGAAPDPGGTSIFYGRHASAVVHWIVSLGLDAKEVVKLQFANEMASKLIWNCTFGLLCDVHDAPVGSLCAVHADDVESLILELVEVANAGLGTTLVGSETIESLRTYSQSIPAYQGTLKQWEWRNGWFVKAARRLSVDTPKHSEFLVGRHPGAR